jgi:hypothetical protein
MHQEILIEVEIPDKYLNLTFEFLESLETIEIGHADDLKINDGVFKVWLCRCDTYDGMPYDNAVTIEKYIDNCWVEVLMYESL